MVFRVLKIDFQHTKKKDLHRGTSAGFPTKPASRLPRFVSAPLQPTKRGNDGLNPLETLYGLSGASGALVQFHERSDEQSSPKEMAASCHFRYIKQKKTATRVTAIQKQPKRQLRLASHCLIPQKKYSAMLISILCIVCLILQKGLATHTKTL